MADRSRSSTRPADTSTTSTPTDGAPPSAEPGTPAGYGKRFVALFLDWILCLLIGGVLATVTGVLDATSLRGFWAYPVLICEYGIFVGLWGQTPGMRLARIRCAPVDHDGVIGVPRALLRGLLLCLVVPPLVVGPGGRGWHDRAARSIMLHT
ncbi:MAG TPA: RDD family protein [Actinocatenispora sp.]